MQKKLKSLLLIALILVNPFVYGQSTVNVSGYDVPADTLDASLRTGTSGCSVQTPQYCIDSTPCKTIQGYNVCLSGVDAGSGGFNTNSTCWTYNTQYTCLATQSNCDQFSTNSSCTLKASSCFLDSGTTKYGCITNQSTYSCVTKAASSTTETICDSSINSNGLDWATNKSSAAAQFVQAAATQEMARQIALYSTNDGSNSTFNIFKGISKQCVKGAGVLQNLKNCCRGGGVALSNGTIAKNLGVQAGLTAFASGAKYAAQYGSQYVYDTALTNGGGALEFAQGFGFFTQAPVDPSFSFGFAGFGTTASSASGTFFSSSSSIALGGEIATDGTVLSEPVMYFNPYAFAAMVAIQMVTAWMACPQDSQELQSAKSQNLCYYVGEYVSKTIGVGPLKIPLEITEGYCCYNGLLAKDIAIGAKPQLNETWGSPQSPDCSGFTAAQLSSLNFAAIDLSDFTAQIQQNATNAAGTYTNAPQGVMSSTATTTINSLCAARQKADPTTVCN